MVVASGGTAASSTGKVRPEGGNYCRPAAGARRSPENGSGAPSVVLLRGKVLAASTRGMQRDRCAKMIGRRRALALGAGALALAAGLGRRAAAAVAGPAIRVNQLGYRPGDPKVALAAAGPRSFAVRQAASQRIVFEGPAGPAGAPDPASGDRVTTFDFGALATPGDYVVTAAGAIPSPPFRIGPAVYADALRVVLRSFGYQRCGAPIHDGSDFARPACHLADAREWAQGGARRDVTGGWHDAGDYGKYVPAVGLTLWHLAAVHELGVDLLDDMRWELDWLLRMQRPDGAVHHKVGPTRWTGDRAAADDREPRYLFGVSSASTATLAATAARLAPLYRPRDPAYAGRLVAGAEAAWGWLERHPDIVPAGGFVNPPGVGNGDYDAYADDDDRDDRFWAAVELWRATGHTRYRDFVLARLEKWTPFDYPASWRRVQNLAFSALIERSSPLDAGPRARLAAALVERSGWVAQAVEQDGGYRAALTLRDYYWGSNGVALGRAVQLLAAFRESRRAAFRQAALEQLHYVFGRNVLGKSFVTGLGADPPRRPYYQPAIASSWRLLVPGMLVGGPNAQREGVAGPHPARAYQDTERLYGVNEPTIYLTAALAHVLAHVVRD
jgi:endoglucanase